MAIVSDIKLRQLFLLTQSLDKLNSALVLSTFSEAVLDAEFDLVHDKLTKLVGVEFFNLLSGE